MPTSVGINLPPSKLALRLELGNVEINRLSGDRASLWSMPSYPVQRRSTWPIRTFARRAAPGSDGSTIAKPAAGHRPPGL